MIQEKISGINWDQVTVEMHEKGFSLIPGMLSHEACNTFINNYDNPALYRKTIIMERYRFGLGEYKYFTYPLPGSIQTLREEIYTKLAPIANTWMNVLHIEKQFPGNFNELQKLCHDNNQTKPTVL